MSTLTNQGSAAQLDGVPRELPLPEPTSWQKINQRFGGLIFLVVDLGLFTIAWQLVQSSAHPLVDPRWIPAPSQIVNAFMVNLANGQLYEHASFSLANYAVGMAFSIVVGIPVGLLLGSTPTMRAILGSYVWAAYSTPIIAVQPILIIIFGFGMTAKVVLITALSIFPILINTMTGVATTDSVLLKAGKLFGANRRQMFTKIILPFTLPWIVAGVRQAAIRGLIAMLISEIYGSTRGLGFMVIRASETMDTPTSYAAIAVVVVISVAIQLLFTDLEKRLAPWRQASEV